MRTTFIIRNLSFDTLASVETSEPRAAHAQLTKWAFGDLRHCVSVKYGPSDAFRDRVEWNGLVKSGKPMTMKAEPRKGYRLITFEA